jgi:putative inorganic carbon (HCO3(-)) transporter
VTCGRKLSAANISTDLNPEPTLLKLTRWALAVTAAAMPLYLVRWHIGPLPTTLLENLELLTVGLYVLTLIRHRAPMPRRTSLDIPIALFLLAGVIGIFVAPDHRGGLGIFRAYLLEPIAIYYVAVAIIGLDKRLETLLAGWSAGIVLFAFAQLVAFVQALQIGKIDPDAAPGALGINPNSVSLFLDPLIGVAAGFALFGRNRTRWVATALLVVMLPADVSTLSRGGLLAIGVLALIAIATTQNWRRQVALLLAAGVTGVVLWKLPILGPRIARALNPSSGTFVGRGRIWAATFRMLRDHPVFGAGINAYQSTMAPYRVADRNLVPEPYPHNIFLTSWTELGLLGLIVFAYMLLALIVQPFRALRRATDDHRPLLWGLGSAFAMVLAHGLVDSPYWKNDLSAEFWLLAALEIVVLKAVYANADSPATAV